MKRKIFTLLTLLLCVCSGAWATNTTLIDGYTLADLPTSALDLSNQTTFTTTDCVDANGNIVIAPIYWSYGSSLSDECPMREATWFTANNFSNSGDTWTAPDGSIFRGSEGWDSNYRRRLNVRKTERNYAVRFKGSEGISILGNANSQTLYLSVYNISAGVIGSLVETASISGDSKIATVNGLTSSNEYVAYIYCSSGTNSYLYEIAFLAPTSDPVINATATTIRTTTSGVEVTEDIAVTGANLTASGTLTATLYPAVTGLSVSLASNSIDGSGAISTTATLHYTATANASGTTTLSLSDGTTIKNVIITYNASVVSWTLQSISSATTWDWSKVTPNSSHALYKNNGIALTDASDPDKNTEFVMENYAGGDLYTIGDGFDGTTISFKGEYPCRYGTVCQNGVVKFNTTVPGKIVVKFNDTGSGASATAVKRYLKVNGENTEYWTSRPNNSSDPEVAYDAQMNVVSGEIAVPAGDVTITGSSAIQIYYVTFTPTEQQVSTLSGRNYASYVTTSKLDFASAEGITAYIATGLNGAEDAVVLQEVNVVPAETPIIVKTDTKGATINVPVTTADASDVSANKLVAGDGTTAWNGTSGYKYYFLKEDQFHEATSGTLQSGKAYLKVASGAGAPQLSIDFGEGETTGINAVKGAEFKVNGEYYNLAGQRVAQPTKGLYIVNGKKVVIK